MSVRCPVLVGRDAELAALRPAIGATGAAACVVADAGIGKSALARAAAEDAERGGVVVCAGRAVDGPSPVPLRPLAEALLAAVRRRGLPDDAGLEPFRGALGRMLPQWRAAGGEPAEDSPLVVGEGVLRLLRALAPDGCLLVLEDLHWADDETLAVLEFLCDNVVGERLGILATSRPEGRPAVLDALARRGAATVVELGPLTPGAVTVMVDACRLPQGLDRAAALQVAATAEGVPLLVEELLALAPATDAGPGSRLPRTVAETVRRRLAEVGPDVSGILVSAALLGRRFDWEVLPPATGLGEQVVLDALQQAVAVQLIETEDAGFRFRHALTRDAVLGSVLAPELAARAVAVRRAVEALHPALPDAWCVLAADLAEISGDRDGAARLLIRAGRRAARDGALGTAEHLGRRARDLAPAPQQGGDADELLLEVLAAAGRVQEAIALGSAVAETLEGADPLRLAAVELTVARAAVAGEQWDTAKAFLDRAAGRLGGASGPSAAGAAADLLSLTAQLMIGTGDAGRAAAVAAEAVAAAERAGAPAVVCEAWEVVGRAERRRDLGAALAAFERAAQVAAGSGLVVQRLRALHELGTIDLLDAARLDRLLEARRGAADAGAVSLVAVLDLQLAAGHHVRGEPLQVLAAAGRAVDGGRRYRLAAVRQWALCSIAEAHALLLDRPAVAVAAEEALSATDDRSLQAAVRGDAYGTLALLTEDRHRARAALESAASLAGSAEGAPPSPWWGLWPLLRAVGGDDAEAALAAAAPAAVSRWNARLHDCARAVLLGRAGEADRAAALVPPLDDGFPSPWLAALARRLVAEAALADGWGDPVPWLADAAAFFDGFPAPAVASACRSLLRRAGVRTRRPPADADPRLTALGVTPREAEVLGLIGLGLSNHELADRLYLSPRTVEKHVENLARKLGTATRNQLVAYAART